MFSKQKRRRKTYMIEQEHSSRKPIARRFQSQLLPTKSIMIDFKIAVRSIDECPVPSNLTTDAPYAFQAPLYFTLFGLFVAVHVIAMAVLYKRWEHPNLYQPERILVAVSSCGGLMIGALILLREAFGRTKEYNLPCDVMLFLVPVFPMVLTPVIVRLDMFRSRMLWYTKDVEFVLSESFRHRRSSFGLSGPLTECLLLIQSRLRRCLMCHGASRLSGSTDLESVNLEDMLLRSKFVATSSFGYIWCGVLFSIPFLAITAVQYALNPFYGNGCTTCKIFPTQALTALIELILILAYGVYLVWDIRRKKLPDPFNVVTEMKRVLICSGTLQIASFILLLLDPYKLSEKGLVNWMIIYVISLGASHNLQCTFPVLKSMLTNLPSQISDIVSNEYFELEKLLMVEEWFELFKMHLQQEMSVENILFWKQTRLWEANFDASTPETNDSRADALYNVFIRDGSMLQVNLPASVRSQLVQVFQNYKTEVKNVSGYVNFIPKDVFQEARANLLELMEDDSFVRFMSRRSIQHAIIDSYNAGIIDVPNRNRARPSDANKSGITSETAPLIPGPQDV